MSLYSIADKYLAVFNDAIDPETGELKEDSLLALNQIDGDFKEKGLAVAYRFKNLEAEATMIDAAICDMEVRRDRLRKEAARCREYLRSGMEYKGITEISCPYFVAKLNKGREELDISDEKFIPNYYFNKKETFSLDRRRLKRDLQDGKEVNGASLKRKPILVVK